MEETPGRAEKCLTCFSGRRFSRNRGLASGVSLLTRKHRDRTGMTKTSMKTPPLELWGGVECTIVRLANAYRDQLAETGHLQRSGDIDLIESLGIRTVRYPILWEMVAPERPDRLDFAWTDERLAMLRERGIRVIGGLVHHGSGPGYTDLLDRDFPAKLADYAAR